MITSHLMSESTPYFALIERKWVEEIVLTGENITKSNILKKHINPTTNTSDCMASLNSTAVKI